jgi:uncharacterized protein (TIGR03437 family)
MVLSVLALAWPVAALAAGPTVTQILNNSSGTPPGLPNSGIAPSSIFIVTGSGLADPGTPVLQSSAAPGLSLTLNGASITVVVNGVTTHPPLYYTSPTQLAAVLPAATPVGTGTLTVTYDGAPSNAASILVVASAVGINHFNQIPIPLGIFNPNVDIGVATDAVTGALLTFTNSGVPGEIITLWATGLGADPADSDTTYASPPHAVNTPLQIYVGGVPATILYQGSAGYPGVTQINLIIPASVTTGCYVSLAAVTGTVISNVVVFPIHPGGGTCVVPGGLTGAQILADVQDTLNAGGLSVLQTISTSSKGIVTVTTSASAAFYHETGLLAGATGRAGILTAGGCWVAPSVAGGPLTIAGLDAGSISLTGPGGLAVALPLLDPGGYGVDLAASAIPSSGGTFTFTGTGGADVGPFTAALTFTNPVFNWTNQSASATVNRAAGSTVTWTGGNPGTFVFIGGDFIVTPSTASSPGLILGYGCLNAAEAGQFTVPPYILLGFPAGSGSTVVNNVVGSTFSFTGLDAVTNGLSGQIQYTMPSTYK